MARQFNVWFGGIFLAVGAVCLVIGAIVVIPLASRPGVPREAWAGLAAPALVGLAFIILGAVSLAKRLRRRRIEQHLRAVGTTTHATVVAVVRTGARLNGRYLWRVHYAYDDLAGVRHHGDSGYLSAADANTYNPGETVLVRFDPAAPTINAWVGREDTGQ